MMEPLTKQFTVACGRAAAFALWTERATLWWPKAHKMTKDPSAAVRFEPRVGGRIYERATDGRELDWGAVLVWEPPERLAYVWHMGTQREHATHVEVQFSVLDAQTTGVKILHSGWERLGEKGPAWRERNLQGWAGVVPSYEAACREAGRSGQARQDPAGGEPEPLR